MSAIVSSIGPSEGWKTISYLEKVIRFLRVGNVSERHRERVEIERERVEIQRERDVIERETEREM